jgi:hypothetical protein
MVDVYPLPTEVIYYEADLTQSLLSFQTHSSGTFFLCAELILIHLGEPLQMYLLIMAVSKGFTIGTVGRST